MKKGISTRGARVALLLALLALPHAAHARQQPSKQEALAAMRRATQFMLEKVSLRGGYVWSVSEDFKRRDGEVPARETQIWIQGGTPEAGHCFLDAYEATRDPLFLDAARRAADALVYGQRPEGGWHYFIDFDPRGTEEWYRAEASRFKWGYEEYRHYYGNATFDDANSAEAARYLLRFYAATLEPAYHPPVVKALDFFVRAQYPNGAWPQRYPLSREFSHDGFPDYTSFYTLNDGAAAANVLTLVAGYELLGDERYLEAAKRGVDFMIAVQGPEGQAAWAEQYDPKTSEPAAARTHEPAGFVVRESAEIVQLLETFYLMTGSARYLRPVPGALAWFERVNRETVELKRPPARYYQLGTNLPVYVIRTEKTNPEGYGLYLWSTTEARGDGFGLYRAGEEAQAVRAFIEVEPMRREYERVSKLTREQARAEYEQRRRVRESGEQPRRGPSPDVAGIIKSLDGRGAWVTDISVLTRVAPPAMNPGTRERLRGYSTGVFVRNMRALTDYVRPAAAALNP
ncbi:MAG TPA: pectate lyase [Pyrinomonadaceae bacterium]